MEDSIASYTNDASSASRLACFLWNFICSTTVGIWSTSIADLERASLGANIAGSFGGGREALGGGIGWPPGWSVLGRGAVVSTFAKRTPTGAGDFSRGISPDGRRN